MLFCRYTSLVNLLPEHSLNAVCIMGTVCKQPSIQSELLSLYMRDIDISRDILTGIVESIEQATESAATTEPVRYSQHCVCILNLVQLSLCLMYSYVLYIDLCCSYLCCTV